MHLKDCLDMYLVQTHNCVWIVFVLSVLEKSESGRERQRSQEKFPHWLDVCIMARAQD